MADPMSFERVAPAPLIMTALFDAQSFRLFDDLRQRHFPAALNRIPAHATLFHHLPGTELTAIRQRVAAACAGLGPLPFAVLATRFLGRGVAFELDCPALAALRDGLAVLWKEMLTAQDRQGYRPHVTVQNKVTAEAARATRRRLDGLLPLAGRIEGLALWHYRGGPWAEAGRFPFTGV